MLYNTNMRVTVVLTGMARDMVRQKEVPLDVDEQITYAQIVRTLGEKFPRLIGLLIDRDGETLLSGNVLIINGDLATPAMVMQASPNDGDRLILMSLVTGG